MAWLDGWRKYITTFLDESKWGEEHPTRNNTPMYPRPAQSAAALPRNLKRLREARGQMVAELSRAAIDRDGRVSASTIRAIERGATNPTLSTVLALARALGVGVEALVEEGGE